MIRRSVKLQLLAFLLITGRGSAPAMISTGPHPLSAQVAEVFTTSYLLSFPPESPQTSLLPQR